MRGQRAFGRGIVQAMNAAAQRRIKNPPPKPYAGWTFTAAVVFGVAARIIYLTGGPRPLGLVCIVIAVLAAAASLVLKMRSMRKARKHN